MGRLGRKIPLFVVFVYSVCQAQLEDRIWVLGEGTGINFINPSNPTLILTGIRGQNENYSCVSDSSGQLLFYLNGINFSAFFRSEIFGSNDSLIGNGNLIHSDASETQGSMFLPISSQDNHYYLFHVSHQTGSTMGFNYSVIRKQEDSGSFMVTEKNINLINHRVSEKLQAVKSANGHDWWIFIRDVDSSGYVRYLLSENGLSDSLVQRTGNIVANNICGRQGQMKISPDGKKLVSINQEGMVELYDVDRCSGELSNWINISPPSPNCDNYYGCSFSPNGKILYVSSWNEVFQVDLLAQNILASATLLYSDSNSQIIIGQHQLGPDGKIYIANANEFVPTTHLDSFNTHLTVIDSPNLLGHGCGLRPYSFSLNNNRCYYGLPNLPNFSLDPLPSYHADAGANITICQGDTAIIGTQTVDSVIYHWTVAGGASHQISSLTTAQPLVWPDSTTTYYLLIDDTVGDYSCAVRDDTITVYVVGLQITGIPQISLIGDSLLAGVDGDTAGLTYHWLFDDSLVFVSSLPVYVPGIEGEYFVEVVDSFGCESELSEGFVFLVDGIFDVQIDTETSSVQVYPNPVRDVLQVAGCKSPVLLTVFDVFGRVVLSEVVYSQDSKVSVSGLESGIYYWVVSPFITDSSTSLGMTKRRGGKVLVLR